MSNAAKILKTLDKYLATPRALILYGRAALVLGFPESPLAAALSMDVDVILTSEQSAALGSDGGEAAHDLRWYKSAPREAITPASPAYQHRNRTGKEKA